MAEKQWLRDCDTSTEGEEPLNIVEIKISDLKPASYNPRKLTKKQYEDIKASLERFGFVDPIIVNSNPERQNIIIGGHQRVNVWKKMGNKSVPVFYVDLDIEKEKELNIRLNRNTGEWDWDILANQFEQNDLMEWGFSPVEFGIGDDDEKEESEENNTEKNDKKTKCPECGHQF